MDAFSGFHGHYTGQDVHVSIVFSHLFGCVIASHHKFNDLEQNPFVLRCRIILAYNNINMRVPGNKDLTYHVFTLHHQVRMSGRIRALLFVKRDAQPYVDIMNLLFSHYILDHYECIGHSLVTLAGAPIGL